MHGKALVLWRYIGEGSPELLPSGSGIHHTLTYMEFPVDLTNMKAACCQKLQGGNPIQPVLELHLWVPKQNYFPWIPQTLHEWSSALMHSELHGELAPWGGDLFHFSLQPSSNAQVLTQSVAVEQNQALFSSYLLHWLLFMWVIYLFRGDYMYLTYMYYFRELKLQIKGYEHY